MRGLLPILVGVVVIGSGCIELHPDPPPPPLEAADDLDADQGLDAETDRPDRPPMVVADLCDGRDEDGDGRADEDFAASDCVTDGLGLCTSGSSACVGDRVVCVPVSEPMEEVCNGLDDDCDGATDEGEAGPLVVPCYDGPPGTVDVGRCRSGARGCVDGQLGACLDARLPAEEACDGWDDDCDGTTDEGVLNACGACGPVADEVCNRQDDDCDGTTDEGVPGCDVICGPPDAGPPRPPCNGAEAGFGVPAGWVVVPAGDFMAGDATCDPQSPRWPVADGQRAVRGARPILMRATEVSRGEWQGVADAAAVAAARAAEASGADPDAIVSAAAAAAGTPRTPPGCGDDGCPEHPIDTISRLDAMWFANARSAEAAAEGGEALSPCYDPAALRACRGVPGSGCEGDEPCDCAPGSAVCTEPAEDRIFRCDPIELARLIDPQPGCTGFRLPTAAEWERAARAGTTPVPRLGDDGALDGPCVCGEGFDCPSVWWGAEGYAGPLPPEACDPEARGGDVDPRGVSEGAPNPFGLREMVGNVVEHVQDLRIDLDEREDPADPLSPLIDPRGPVGLFDGLALGSNSGSDLCSTTRETAAPPSARLQGTGFRLVRSIEPGPYFEVFDVLDATAAGADAWQVQVRLADRLVPDLVGRVWLWHEGRSHALAGVQVVGDGAERTLRVPFAALDLAGVPRGPEGSGPHLVIVSFTDPASGERANRALWLTAGCDGQDDDRDGRADDGLCAEVTCDGDPRGPPPCNGAPAETVIPNGWVYVSPGNVTIGADEDAGTNNAPAFDAHVSRGYLIMDAEVTRETWAAAVRSRADELAGLPERPSNLETPSDEVCTDEATDADCPLQNITWWEALWLANVLSVEAGLSPCYPPDRLDACIDPPTPLDVGGRPALWCGGPPSVEAGTGPILWPDYPGAIDPTATCDGYRLPTEAEWLRAVHGEVVVSVPSRSVPVRSGLASRLGLYGMADGVFEWTADSGGVYVPLPPPRPVLLDPLGPRNLFTRVARGGGRDGERVARSFGAPEKLIWSVGVRFVRSLEIDVPPAAGWRSSVVVDWPTVTPDQPGTVQIRVEPGDAEADGSFVGSLVVYRPGLLGPSAAVDFERADPPQSDIYRAVLPWEIATYGLGVADYCGEQQFRDGRLIYRFARASDADEPAATWAATGRFYLTVGQDREVCVPQP